MSVPVSEIRQRLDGLSASDENYRKYLLELLNHQDLKPYIYSLQRSDLRGLVELLDEALNHIPVTDGLFGKILRRLQSTCSNCEVLPGSYLIQSEKISDRGVPIAAGDFGDTYEAEFDGKKVCIKTLRSYVQDTGGVINKIFYGEVVVWKRMRHPNIVPFLGVPTKMPPPFEIVCEWMENSTINGYVRKYPQVDRIELLWDVADGLHYLHSCGIVHGNLKGVNVLIDKNGHARLTDFGLISFSREDTSVGSPQDMKTAGATTWAAPEILRGGAVTKEGDVFTFAMVAVETFTGHSPFITNYQSALYDIMSGKRPRKPETMSNDELWGLIQRSWDQDPGRRPTTLELLDFFRTSFPGERETSKTHALPRAPSAWTLKDPGVNVGKGDGPLLDSHWRNTQDINEQGPQDPPAWNPQITGPGPLISADEGTSKLDKPAADGDRRFLVDHTDTPPDVQLSIADPPGSAVPVPEDEPAASLSLFAQLWKAVRARVSAVKLVFPFDRMLKGRNLAKPEQDEGNIEVQRGLLPILSVRRRR